MNRKMRTHMKKKIKKQMITEMPKLTWQQKAMDITIVVAIMSILISISMYFEHLDKGLGL